MKKFELLAASAIALIAAVPAAAQTTPDTTPAAAADTQDDSASPENDIVITATKRATTLQDTPISVSVTTADSIERAQVRDLLDLQTLVPSLKVGQLQSSANTNFIIRGFGNGANNIGIEPSVAVFIDGVYRSRSSAQISDLPNIQRVEVLRGPQSTLFGKNASAGVISIVTEVPQFEFGGSAEASYGNYNAVVLKGDITGPITKTVAFSLAGNYNRRDGYANYVNLGIKGNDRNRYGFRGQLLFEPSSDFKIRLIGDYDRIDETCCTVANLVDGPTGNAVRFLGGKINSGQRYSYDSYANFPSVTKIDNYGFSGQIDYAVTPQLALTSISSYRRVKTYTNADSDFTSADLIGKNELTTKVDTYTQEIRLASSFDGPLNFLIGGFYFKEDIKSDGSLLFGKDFKGYANLLTASTAFPTGAYSALEPTLRQLLGMPASTPATAFGAQGQGRFEHYTYGDEAYSIFGQIDLEPVKGLTFTAGFNYTNDRKAVTTNDSSTDTFSSLDLVQAGFNYGVAVLHLTPAQAQAFATNRGTGGNPFLALQPLQFLPPFLNYPNAVEDGKTHDDNLSYTLRVAYKFNRNVNAYASYATGFKASSFNLSYDSRPFASDFIPGSPLENPAASPIRTAGLALANLTSGTRYAGPEKAQVYEIGVKGNFEGFGINIAVFKQILEGFQSNVFQGTGFVLANAEQQSTKGAEIDATMSPTKNLTFTASLTYLDPKYDKFTGGSSFNPATNTVVPTNLTGATPSGISKFSVAVGGTYTVPLADEKALVFHVDYAHDSAFQIAAGLPYKAAPESLNASVAVKLLKGLEIAVWGRNLTEPKYNPVIFPGVAQTGTLSAYPSPPRTYGADIRFEF